MTSPEKNGEQQVPRLLARDDKVRGTEVVVQNVKAGRSEVLDREHNTIRFS
jgi:hypothetical protein